MTGHERRNNHIGTLSAHQRNAIQMFRWWADKVCENGIENPSLAILDKPRDANR